MRDIATMLRDPEATVAVVGATDNPSKYGAVIYRDLKKKGFTVWPVNPGRDSVDGDQAFPSIAALPEEPTIINIVVPPQRAIDVLRQAKELGYMNVWLQPGAESPAALTYLQEHGFTYLANACIMVQSRVRAH